MELNDVKELIYSYDDTLEESNKLRKIMAGAALGLNLATAGIPKLHAQDATKVERSTDLNSFDELNFTEEEFKKNFKYVGEVTMNNRTLYKWTSKDEKKVCISNFHTDDYGGIVVEKSADSKYFSTISNDYRKNGKESTILTLRQDMTKIGHHIAAVDKDGNVYKDFYACGIIRDKS